MKAKIPLIRLLLIASTSIQMGCVGNTPPASFYLLEPITNTEKVHQNVDTSLPTVVVAPVRIPRYLERPQMVMADGGNRYRLDELHRWAEALDDNITRVMMQDLSALLPANVISARANPPAEGAFKISVTILAFHVDAGGQAQLDAQWQIVRGGDALVRRQTSYRSPVSTDDAGARVAAMNDCLRRLNQDIASTLRTAIGG